MRQLGFALAAAAAAALYAGNPAVAQDKIKIGYVVAKSGPNAPGAGITTIPNYKLWVTDVNAAGGINVGGKKMQIEVVEYDDQSSTEEAVKGIERLATEDKVDLILPPWGTGTNLAVAPVIAKYGYPHLAVTAATDMAPEMVKRFPNSFWFLGTSSQGADALVEVLNKLKAKGLGTNIAMVSVADQFGIELSKAARPALDKAGFKLVYDKSYPVTTQDFAPIINEAKAANPDAFVAFSYPPDTFGLTGTAIALGFNPKVFYTAVGTAFMVYKDQFKDNVDGVMGVGGVNPDTPEMQAYFKHHKEVTGQDADRWASPVTYASLQILQQAIEKVGSLDKQKIADAIKAGEFDTVLGKVKMVNNIRQDVWWAGQWQGGEFYGLGPTSIAGAKEPLFPKPDWKK